METNAIPQAELRHIGHVALAGILYEYKEGAGITTEQATKMGILATLLLLAEDISRLVGMYNTVTMQERTR